MLTLIAALCLATTFTVTVSAFEVARNGNGNGNGNGFSGNITLDGVNLSEYSFPLAFQKFNQRTQSFLHNFQVTVILNDVEYYINANDIAFEINTLDLLNEIWFSDGYHADGTAFLSTFSYDSYAVQAFADRIVEDLWSAVPPLIVQNPIFDTATRTFTDGPFESRKIGYDLDPVAFLEQINSRINEAIWENANHHASLNIQSNPIYNHPSDALAEGHGLISTFTTFTTNVPNRNTNIRRSSEILTGTRVGAGEIFSFNDTQGFTYRERGFVDAGVIINDEIVQGLGGGICQVSSTIFNAVLNADLRVVERHPHTMPVDYVPPNRDAAVSYQLLDFRFQNTTNNNIWMMIGYDGHALTVSLYGRRW